MKYNFSVYLVTVWQSLRKPIDKYDGIKSIIFFILFIVCLYLNYLILSIPHFYEDKSVVVEFPNDTTNTIIKIDNTLYHKADFGAKSYNLVYTLRKSNVHFNNGSVLDSVDCEGHYDVSSIMDFLRSEDSVFIDDAPRGIDIDSIKYFCKIGNSYDMFGMSSGPISSGYSEWEDYNGEKLFSKSIPTLEPSSNSLIDDGKNGIYQTKYYASNNKRILFSLEESEQYTKIWNYIFAPYDISQSFVTYRYNIDIVDSIFVCFSFLGSVQNYVYIGTEDYVQNGTNFSFTYSKYPSMDFASDNGKCFDFYLSFPELQNLQSLRIFLLGLFLTFFFTLWINSLKNFIINKIRLHSK